MKKILILLLLAIAVSAQANVTATYYGKVQAEDGTTLYAYVGEKQFVTRITENKYGYSPPFEVKGQEGEEVNFYIGDELIKTTNLEEGLVELNLDGTEAEEVPTAVVPEPQPEVQADEETDEKSASTVILLIGLALIMLALFLYLLLRPKKAKYDLRLYMYLQDLLAKGYRKEQLIPYLKQQGWDEKIIEATFKKLGN